MTAAVEAGNPELRPVFNTIAVRSAGSRLGQIRNIMGRQRRPGYGEHTVQPSRQANMPVDDAIRGDRNLRQAVHWLPRCAGCCQAMSWRTCCCFS